MAGMNDEGRQWYVVNTYSGHENKVREKKNIKQEVCANLVKSQDT